MAKKYLNFAQKPNTKLIFRAFRVDSYMISKMNDP